MPCLHSAALQHTNTQVPCVSGAVPLSITVQLALKFTVLIIAMQSFS